MSPFFFLFNTFSKNKQTFTMTQDKYFYYKSLYNEVPDTAMQYTGRHIYLYNICIQIYSFYLYQRKTITNCLILPPTAQTMTHNTVTQQKCCHATFIYSTCSQTLTLNNQHHEAAVNSKMKPVRPVTYKNMVLIQIQHYKEGIYYLKHLNSAYGHFCMWYIK